jgi:hypothetical protein
MCMCMLHLSLSQSYFGICPRWTRLSNLWPIPLLSALDDHPLLPYCAVQPCYHHCVFNATINVKRHFSLTWCSSIREWEVALFVSHALMSQICFIPFSSSGMGPSNGHNDGSESFHSLSMGYVAHNLQQIPLFATPRCGLSTRIICHGAPTWA